MIRTKGEAGTGNVVEAVRHIRKVSSEIRKLQNTPDEELMTFAKILVLLMNWYRKSNAWDAYGT